MDDIKSIFPVSISAMNENELVKYIETEKDNRKILEAVERIKVLNPKLWLLKYKNMFS